MATIQINIVDQAPFFYTLEDGDSYSTTQTNEPDQLVILVADATGTPKKEIVVTRDNSSVDGSSMAQNLQEGMEIAEALFLATGNPSQQLPIYTGEAWDSAVSSAVSGNEPGLFQEVIWYCTQSEKAVIQASIDIRKESVETLKAQLEENLKAACDEDGGSGIRGPLGPIECGASGDKIDGIANAAIGPLTDIPYVGKVGVVYKSVTVQTPSP